MKGVGWDQPREGNKAPGKGLLTSWALAACGWGRLCCYAQGA